MNILVVDDDATNRMVLKGLLEREGHQVMMAENGQEAIDKFGANDPDMVLMDVMMPVMDGYEAARIIKEQCGNQRFVPIMFLTAMSGDDALVNCIQNGGDDFLKKPYNRSILSAKISALDRIRSLYDTVHQQRTALVAFQEHTVSEHDVAEKIFANVMQQGDMDLPMVRTLRQSAEAFNGDIVLIAHNPSGGVNILVGDFTGHGLAAAIGAMPVADVFYKMTSKGFPIDDIIPEINNKLIYMLPTGRFLAACLMNIDSQCRQLTVWNGGMPDILIFNPLEKNIADRIPSQRLPLGVLNAVDLDPKPHVIQIAPGSKIYAYSDGVTELVNSKGKMFGQDRLEEIVLEYSEKKQVVDVLKTELDAFCEGVPQHDDITFLEFDCNPTQLLKIIEKRGTTLRKAATEWNVEFELKPDALRSTDPLPILMQLLTEFQGFNAQRENIFTILSELYNNALDHGILALDSSMKQDAVGFAAYYLEREKRLSGLENGFMKIGMKHAPIEGGGKLSIFFEDSGKGFDFTSTTEEMSSNTSSKGRGILLLRELCDDVTYCGSGNRVHVVLRWYH